MKKVRVFASMNSKQIETIVEISEEDYWHLDEETNERDRVFDELVSKVCGTDYPEEFEIWNLDGALLMEM